MPVDTISAQTFDISRGFQVVTRECGRLKEGSLSFEGISCFEGAATALEFSARSEHRSDGIESDQP